MSWWFDYGLCRRIRRYTLEETVQKAFADAAGTPSGGDSNSQMIGSDVLVFPLGNAPMDFFIAFPDGLDPAGDPKTYHVRPEFTFPLVGGTLFVFKAVDDLIFRHGAEFRAEHRGHVCAWRVALVFRWLQSERDFLVATNTMKPLAQMRQNKEERAEASKRQKANARKDALRGPFS